MKKQICKSFHKEKHSDDSVDNQLQKYLEEHPEYEVKTIGYDVIKYNNPAIGHSIKQLKQFTNKEEHLFVVFSVDEDD